MERGLERMHWIVAICAALNLWWWFGLLPDSGWHILRAAYYWVASFVLLAVALGRAASYARGEPAAPLVA